MTDSGAQPVGMPGSCFICSIVFACIKSVKCLQKTGIFARQLTKLPRTIRLSVSKFLTEYLHMENVFRLQHRHINTVSYLLWIQNNKLRHFNKLVIRKTQYGNIVQMYQNVNISTRTVRLSQAPISIYLCFLQLLQP